MKKKKKIIKCNIECRKNASISSHTMMCERPVGHKGLCYDPYDNIYWKRGKKK